MVCMYSGREDNMLDVDSFIDKLNGNCSQVTHLQAIVTSHASDV